jgi:hypothetical protein
MAYNPIANYSTQFVVGNYGGWYLKAYAQGTTTPISIATDSAGGTLLAKAYIDPTTGFIKTASGGTIFIPHLDAAYDLWIFPTSTEADADDTANAVQIADNMVAPSASDRLEWGAVGVAATYLSATTFSVSGDQTATFHSSRKIKLTGGADRYARVLSSVYGSVTTVTVRGVIDSTGAASTLHASNDAAYLSILAANVGNANSNIFDITPSEIAAGLAQTDLNTEFAYGDSRRYGDVSDADNTTQLQNMFAAVTSGRLEIYAGTYNFDNSGGALSFLSNVDYIGIGNVIIQPTVSTERIFDTDTQSNFSVKNIRSYGADEVTDNRIGGGYWRFLTCSDFIIEECEMSNHAWDGFKFDTCDNFKAINNTSNYGKSTGITCDRCTNFKLLNNTLNKNGLNSVDDSYADLPTAWTGTHVGRGITLADQCDQGEVAGNQAILNSEYGIRSYADASTGGNTNISIHDNYIEDSGHPAGTYGTVVLGSNKGVDILIDSDATIQTTSKIEIYNNKILRSAKGWGNPMSLAATKSKVYNNTIDMESSALNLLAALSLYGWKQSSVYNNVTRGSLYHISIGGGGTTDIIIDGEKAYDCIKFIHSTLTGDSQVINCYAKHIATAAISGENGITISGTDIVIIKNNIFDGFYDGIKLNAATPYAYITGNTTFSSVDRGLEGATVTTQTYLEVFANNFDGAYPGVFATFEYNGRGSLSRAVCTFNAPPSTGGTNGGALMNWSVGDFVYNSAPSVDGNNMILTGWVCTAAGTPGTWQPQYISTVSPAT